MTMNKWIWNITISTLGEKWYHKSWTKSQTQSLSLYDDMGPNTYTHIYIYQRSLMRIVQNISYQMAVVSCYCQYKFYVMMVNGSQVF